MNSADDHEMRMKYHEPLTNTLSSKESFNSSVLAAISKEFSTDCILHEAIGLGNPNHVLILLANRFLFLPTQVDSNVRYHVRVTCACGASLRFFSHCIDRNPSSVATKDIEGKTPIHHLCQNIWKDLWGADLTIQLI